jgi:hypothetical protein
LFEVLRKVGNEALDSISTLNWIPASAGMTEEEELAGINPATTILASQATQAL